MKTQQELQLHYWGPHFEMVKEYNAKHDTDIGPWECVKYINDVLCGDPQFPADLENYTFALAILYDDKRKEHRPVFVNDRLWLKNAETYLEVTGCVQITEEYYAWNPPAPKRMFKINDVELNSPVQKDKGDYVTRVCGNEFYFTNYDDRNALDNILYELLTAARDKE